MNKIEVKNLKYSYDHEKLVIDDVSFTVEKGAFVSFLGHNGSGKSTIAKIIVGLLDGYEGDIYFDLPAGEVLKGKSEIKLDGVTPKINSIAISSDGLKDTSNNEYCTKDKTITAVLTMSENVLVSDSPERIFSSAEGRSTIHS